MVLASLARSSTNCSKSSNEQLCMRCNAGATTKNTHESLDLFRLSVLRGLIFDANNDERAAEQTDSFYACPRSSEDQCELSNCRAN